MTFEAVGSHMCNFRTSSFFQCVCPAIWVWIRLNWLYLQYNLLHSKVIFEPSDSLLFPLHSFALFLFTHLTVYCWSFTYDGCGECLFFLSPVLVAPMGSRLRERIKEESKPSSLCSYYPLSSAIAAPAHTSHSPFCVLAFHFILWPFPMLLFFGKHKASYIMHLFILLWNPFLLFLFRRTLLWLTKNIVDLKKVKQDLKKDFQRTQERLRFTLAATFTRHFHTCSTM